MASSTESEWIRTTQNSSSWITSDSNQSLDDLPTDCNILGLNVTIPWDNPHNLISYETDMLIERWKSIVVVPILFLVGFPSNVVNMAVFYKQGLKDRINMCLFALAVADIINVTYLFTLSAQRMYGKFTDSERYTPSFRFIMNTNIIGLSGLKYGSYLVSAVISAERCVCVLFPLRAQRCMPTKTLALILFFAASSVISLYFVIIDKYQVECVHEMLTGRTSWQVYEKYRSELHKTALTSLNGVLYGFVISLGCPFVVFFTTTITAIKLSQIVRWRRQAASSLTSAAMSSKEVGLTKMLICLSVEFFVLSIPTVVLRIVPLFRPELTMGGRYTNTSRLFISLDQVCLYASSSINFFVYYCTGTKFRQTLHAMMARGSRADKQTPASSCVLTTSRSESNVLSI